MLLSIIICTYNRKKLLNRALECILNQQTDFPFEVIVGDDGSTDGTDELLAKYKEKFPDKLVHLDNPVKLCCAGSDKDFSYLIQASDYGKHYVDEMVRVFQREGTKKFEMLCIWDNPYLKAAGINPKLPLWIKLLHYYLRKTQSFSNKRTVKFVDKIFKLIISLAGVPIKRLEKL